MHLWNTKSDAPDFGRKSLKKQAVSHLYLVLLFLFSKLPSSYSPVVLHCYYTS